MNDNEARAYAIKWLCICVALIVVSLAITSHLKRDHHSLEVVVDKLDALTKAVEELKEGK